MATEVLSGSDCSLSPKLFPSPPGSPKDYLSPVDEIPYLPDLKESLLYKPDPLRSPKSPSRAAHLRERSSKRHIPYPLRPSPLQLRFANRDTGQAELDFTSEQLQEYEEMMSSDLSRISFGTLYKAFKAALAGREAARYEVATSLWQVEYSERITAFNQALHQENRDRLNMRDAQLKKIRNTFSEHDRTVNDGDTVYLQAAYDDECEMLRAITTQAESIASHLGPCAKRDLLASTGDAPYLPRFVGTLRGRDNITHALCGGFTDTGTDTDIDSDIDLGEDDDHYTGWPDQPQRLLLSAGTALLRRFLGHS
ncbi:hypothetical protein EDD22DRAFT_854373 [Suillus occidentalis]|nr:hypothetical protein EDD22DRAFT_854373 [Suillus occidentalis]